jgi:tetratricopeptide (TPR) repeat protein
MGPDDGAWQAIPPATKATGTLSSAPPPADFQGIGDSAASAASAASPPAAESEAPPISEGPLVRQAGGGTAFGEVNLAQTEAGPSAEVAVPARVSRPGGAGWGERRPGQPSDDDMEFGAIPQEDGAGGEKPQRGSSGAAEAQAVPAMQQAAGARASATGAAGAQVQLPPKKSRAVRILGALLLVVVAGGGALAATPYGAFGAHAIGDAVHAKEYGRLLGSTVQETRKNLGRDTAEAASEAGTQCDEAQTRAPRFAPLTAYAAFVGFQREVRYGADPAIHAHATAQLADAAKRSKDAEYLALASAAEALASGRVAKARAEAGALAQRYPDDIDVAVLAAEVETFAGEASAALEAWQRAARLSPTARTAHGLARAHFALGQLDKAREQADKALAFTPDHVGARILLSRVLRKAGDDERAMARVEEVTKLPATRAAASKSELVAAHTLVGQIHLARSRMSMSEAAFGEALKLDPKDAGALCGFGEVLYREGRFTEALARYEAGLQADAESVAAKIGTAKTKIALDRLQDAKDILRKLRESRPADPVVAYWLARVEEALGNKAEVEKILVDAIARTPPSQGAIDLYVAYAQFLSAQGRAQESDAKLAEARQKLPDTPLVHKALGEVALSAGRTDDAKREFEAALQRDPQDLAAMFNLAVTLRRIARFDDAQAMFDKVAAADKNYPGLALERGVLFEASGQAQRALEMYQEALSKAPDDPDLMLRVGSAEVAAGHAAQAEEILRKVLQARPNGAEANHYLGRALLLKGNNLAEALRYLQRAAEIDPNRAEYWLYIGWAANEAGQPSNAQETLKKALELDKGLADAYWQRGILLRRQGAIRDAERDLLKAIELKPSRFEAHATLAECYEDQARWPNAIGAWRKAISADGTRSFWRYKLGRLLYNNGNRAEAGEELAHAVQLAIKEARPHWLWEAYLMLAETNKAAGRRTEAATYYREFLKLAPSESPFRNDALRELQKMGERLD